MTQVSDLTLAWAAALAVPPLLRSVAWSRSEVQNVRRWARSAGEPSVPRRDLDLAYPIYSAASGGHRDPYRPTQHLREGHALLLAREVVDTSKDAKEEPGRATDDASDHGTTSML